MSIHVTSLFSHV